MSIVVRIWLWPSSSMTTRGWTFSLSSRVAAVCRPSCSRTCVVPLRARQHPLAELRGLVSVQLGDQRQREGQGAVAPLALRLLVDQPATADAVDAAPDGESVGQQVDVLPLQRQGLGLAQAQGERDGPAGGVADVRRGLQDGAGLGEVQAVATSLGRWAGGSTRAATLRGTCPRWTATVSARDRIRWILPRG
jgi:hypothetical protein